MMNWTIWENFTRKPSLQWHKYSLSLTQSWLKVSKVVSVFKLDSNYGKSCLHSSQYNLISLLYCTDGNLSVYLDKEEYEKVINLRRHNFRVVYFVGHWSFLNGHRFVKIHLKLSEKYMELNIKLYLNVRRLYIARMIEMCIYLFSLGRNR